MIFHLYCRFVGGLQEAEGGAKGTLTSTLAPILPYRHFSPLFLAFLSPHCASFFKDCVFYKRLCVFERRLL